MNPQPKKWRNKDYLAFIRRQQCLYAYKGRDQRCNGKVEAHHVRSFSIACPGCFVGMPFPTDGGMGLKPSDCFCVPLCAAHHRIIEDHPAWLGEDFPNLPWMMVEYLSRFIDRGGKP